MADAICGRLVEGKSLRAICRAKSMPDASTVYRWLTAQPTFREQYARAREVQGEVYADKAVDEAMSAKDPQIGRLRMDALKWAASKLAPKKFGDKVQLTGDGGGPIRTITGEMTPKEAADAYADMMRGDG